MDEAEVVSKNYLLSNLIRDETGECRESFDLRQEKGCNLLLSRRLFDLILYSKHTVEEL
jgi:hypothetical protein